MFAANSNPPVYANVLSPILRHKSALVRTDGRLEVTVELAAEDVGKQGGIFIIMDSDGDCPVSLAREMLGRAQAARSDVPISVVIAKWEYESWFLAAALSLRGRRRLSLDLEPPGEPENVQDAKGWLSRHMTSGGYSATRDQAALTHVFDLEAARSVRSFRKCHKEITDLLTRLGDQE